MPMSGAMLVEGSSEEFEVKVCVHPDSVLCLLLFIVVLETLSLDSTLGSPGRTCMPMTLLSLLNHSRNVSGKLLTWKEAMEEKGSSKCRKDEDHDLWCGPGPPAEFRRVSICHLSHWSGQQQHLLQQLQALGAQEMQWDQAFGKGH